MNMKKFIKIVTDILLVIVLVMAAVIYSNSAVSIRNFFLQRLSGKGSGLDSLRGASIQKLRKHPWFLSQYLHLFTGRFCWLHRWTIPKRIPRLHDR